MKKTWILATVITAAAALALVAASRKQAAPAAKEPLHAALVRPEGAIAAPGRVEPQGEEIKIGPEMDGKLQRVLVDEGDEVRSGQVIAILSNGDFQARVLLAQAVVEERTAMLERLRNGARDEQKREAEAQLREAESQLQTARDERARRQTLLERGAVSRSEFDLTARDESAWRARVDAARERLALVRTETRAEDLRRAEAELAHARASLEEARAQLEKTFVRASISGRVLRRYRKSGESVSVQADTPILSIGNLDRLRVRVEIDETDVSRLRVGQPAYVTAEAYGDRRFTGRVIRIGQILGRKQVRKDEPSERIDTKVLETLVELDAGQLLPVGLRVDAFLEVAR